MRAVLVLVLLAGMVVSAASGPAAALGSAAQAAAATPCCPEDCPPVPECAAACAAIAQCRTAPAALVQDIGFRPTAGSFAAMNFGIADLTSDYAVLRTGLRKPPKT